MLDVTALLVFQKASRGKRVEEAQVDLVGRGQQILAS